VERDLAHRGDGLEDGIAGELVAEAEAFAVDTKHACGDAVAQPRGVAACDLREEPRLAMGADDRGGIERGPAHLRESSRPGQDRVPHRLGDRGGAARQGLRREEGVSRGPAMKLDGIEGAAFREPPHGGFRQAGQGEPPTDAAVARSPSTTRRGWVGPTSSSR
jgi:hypothetical protein